MSEQYEDMKQRLHSKDEEVKVLQAENQDLKVHVHKLEAVTSQTQEEVKDLEQYGRRECLEFQGLAWNKNEFSPCLNIGWSGLESGRDQCRPQTFSCLR